MALLLLFFSACKKPLDFEYRSLKNVKLENLGFNRTTLAVDLVYYNPNNFGVDLRKVDCDVFVDSSLLGKFQLDTLMHIPRLSEFFLPSRIVVDMNSVLKNGLFLLFSKEVLITVKGTTRVGKGGLFKTVPFVYESKQKLSLF